MGAEYLTYEPYALLVSRDKPELVQFVQKRVYQIFSRRATATARFASYFPKRSMSRALAYLYLLNAVDSEQDSEVPHATSDEAQGEATGPPSAAAPGFTLAEVQPGACQDGDGPDDGFVFVRHLGM